MVRDEYLAARAQVMEEADHKCFVTGEPAEVCHHGFDFSTYPWWGATKKNLFPMTRDAHQAYHQWMGGYRVSTTPISLYWWAYFVRTKRGWFWLAAIAAIVALIDGAVIM